MDIEFIYIGEYAWRVTENFRPYPSIQTLPEWFKQMESYERGPENPNGNKIIVDKHASNATAKKCVPMRDAMCTGYTVPLWTDVQVRQNDGGPYISWRVEKDVFELHGPSSRRITPPLGYDSVVFKFNTGFRVKTPKGYSVMIRPVAGHYDLPFMPIPAIIDTDKVSIDHSFPLWVKSGLDDIVEKGTPIAQIIPFKRENWKSKFSYISEEDHIILKDTGFESTIVNNYIKNIWSKKEFK